MNQEEIYRFAQSLGLRCIDSQRLVGVWKGFPFFAVHRHARVTTVSAAFNLLKGPKAKELRRLRKELPKGCALSWTSTNITLACSGPAYAMTELFSSAMDALTALFIQTNSTFADACPFCRGSNCDSFALMNNAYVPVHRTCCEQHAGNTISKAQVNALHGNYVSGWIGAFLGGLVAALPSILLAWFMEMISAWLYALIPLGAYYGYKLLRGRMNRMATVATVVASLFQIFLIEQVICYMMVVTNWHIWPSPLDTIAFYYQNLETSAIIVTTLQSLIFLALGFFIVFRVITRTNANDTYDADVMAASILPRTPSSGVQSQPGSWDSGQFHKW